MLSQHSTFRNKVCINLCTIQHKGEQCVREKSLNKYMYKGQESISPTPRGVEGVTI